MMILSNLRDNRGQDSVTSTQIGSIVTSTAKKAKLIVGNSCQSIIDGTLRCNIEKTSDDVVLEKKWLDRDEILRFLAILIFKLAKQD